ncbi:hypothetical protein DK853_39655, partial [Klebsiella oxytoca]
KMTRANIMNCGKHRQIIIRGQMRNNRKRKLLREEKDEKNNFLFDTIVWSCKLRVENCKKNENRRI